MVSLHNEFFDYHTGQFGDKNRLGLVMLRKRPLLLIKV